MEEKEKIVELERIKAEVNVCTLCRLSKTRTKAVPGSGDFNTEIMFIGEAPGENEDKEGIPFCGAAGKFLDEMLGTIQLDRNNIFITNCVKCRPPANRDPEDDEKLACRPYLERQIELIKPKLIICLGRHAAASLLPGQPSISKIHGHALKRANGIVYLPLYHPAAALHNGGLRKTLIEDFGKIVGILKKLEAEKQGSGAADGGKNNNIKQDKLI